MTNEDYSKVPPPHLLKKFSEQAREDSQKRGHPGYCKTFAKLCIDWAFQEAAMDDLRDASAEVSGVELNSKSSPNNLQIRSSGITPPPELVQQWIKECDRPDDPRWQEFEQDIATRAAQWGADQELEACCEWLEDPDLNVDTYKLRAARRPKPPSLKEQALAVLDDASDRLDAAHENIIRRAVEMLPD